MKALICLVVVCLLVLKAASDEDFEKLVDIFIQNLPDHHFYVGTDSSTLPKPDEKGSIKLDGYARLSQGYNLTVEMTEMMFGPLRGSKRSPGKLGDCIRIGNYYELEFWMDIPHPELLNATVFTSEPAGKSSDQCYLTSTCKNLISAQFKEPLRVLVSLEYNLLPGETVKVRTLEFKKDPEYITKIYSCKIKKDDKCREFAAWIDKVMWPLINSHLKSSFRSIMEKMPPPQIG